jgi:hypothetical protein
MDDRLNHECIDPDLGDQLWRLDDPATDGRLRQRLEHHVAHCAACRLQLAVGEALADGLRTGRLVLAPSSRRRRRLAARIAGGGAVALAASLILLLALPPAAPTRVLRDADGGPRITRPLSDEVVLGGQPTIAWAPADDAREYEVTVTDPGNDVAWSTRTTATEARPPADAALAVGRRYRIAVTPVPAYAGRTMRETFRTGDALAFVGHRIRHGDRAARVMGLVALVVMVMAGIARFLPPRAP